MLPRTLECFLLALLLVAVIIAFFHPVVFSGRTFQTTAYEMVSGTLPSGPFRYPEPLVDFERRPVKDPSSSAYNEEIAPYLINRYLPVHLPLWNPYVACGTPLAANPIHSTYAPTTLLVSLLPSPGMWDFACLLRFVVAGVGVLLLTARLNVGSLGGLLAAIGYALTGYCVSYANLVGMNVDMLLPWMLWAADRVARGEGRLGGALSLALVWSLALLGGNPEAFIVDAFAALLYLFWRTFIGRDYNERVEPIEVARTIVVAGAITVGLTLFHTLPFIEFYFHGHQTHEAGTGLEARGIYETLPLFTPSIYTKTYEMGGYFPPYFGAMLLVLACFALNGADARGRRAAFFLVLALLFLAKLTGMGFVNWIGHLPVLRYVVFTKYLAPLYLGLAVLAGCGLDNLWNRRASSISAGVCLALLGAGYALLFWRNGTMLARVEPDVAAAELLTRLESVGFRVAIVMALAGGAGYFASRLDRGHRYLVAALALAAFIEVWSNFPKHWALRHNVYEAPAYVETLRDQIGGAPDRVHGVDVTLMPQLAGVYGVQDTRNFAVLNDRRYRAFMKTALATDESSGKDPYFESMFTGSQSADSLDSPLLDMLGARFVLSEDYLGVGEYQRRLLAGAEFVEGSISGACCGSRRGRPHIAVVAPSRLRVSVTVPADGDLFDVSPFIDATDFSRIRGSVPYGVSILENGAEPVVLLEGAFDPKRADLPDPQPRRRFALDHWRGQTVSLELSLGEDKGSSAPITLLWRDLYQASFEDRLRRFRLLHDGPVKVYENTTAAPRAWLVDEWRVVDPELTLSVMMNDEFDYMKVALLEREPARSDLARLSGENATTMTPTVAGEPIVGGVVFEHYSPNTIVVSTDSSRPGWLILSDTYYPGWRVFVNGWPRRVSRVDGFLRAVALDAGPQRVTFRYIPLSFWSGVAVLLLTFIALARALRVSSRRVSDYTAPVSYASVRR